jgi:hypothetical protein
MLGSKCWLEFNEICKNTHAGIFKIFLQDLTTNPNEIPLSETFRNLNTQVLDVC